MGLNFRAGLGQSDVLILTLDALRYDVAATTLAAGRTPVLAGLIGSWERRHSPGTFTLPAHQAFFAGFFPTPPGPGPHPRSLALRFPGSRSVDTHTLVLPGESLMRAYAAHAYTTLCFGGTGFFDPRTRIGAALTRDFDEVHFERSFGVSSRSASARMFRAAATRLADLPAQQRCFIFLNAAATHPPTRRFLPGARAESPETQAAALADLDAALPLLLDALRLRGGALGVICADHGTCFGEDGYAGHRVAHPSVWEVPYAEVEIV